MREAPDVLPRDEHNTKLVKDVHPPDWVNPEPAERYNLVVIGAGTAGLVTAAGAAGLGAKVALVEKHLMGGDCLNVGCVPSKAVIRASRAAADVRGAGAYGVKVPEGVEVDFGAVMERMRRLRAEISSHDSAERFRSLGVDVFLGEGRFAGVDTVEVAGRRLAFRKAVIATGARALELHVPGMKEADVLTNETVFSLTELPRRLAVIGAGPIGCELAQAFRRLGSEVVLLELAPRILIREDRDAAGIVEKALVREGVELVLGCTIRAVERGETGTRLHLDGGGRERTIETDRILLGAGRVPNVEGLNLEGVGVEYDPKAGVHVDDRLRTSNPKIFAAGDICSRYQFTHAADAAARIVIQNALFRGTKKYSALTIPWCTYTDPEIAHVGMYEKDAAERGKETDTFTVPFSEVDRAVLDGEEEGMVRIHTRKGRDEILGATIVARHAGEMIGEISVAMAAGMGLGGLAGVIHPYPTQAEAIKRAADAWNRTRLTPTLAKVFGTLLRWQRGS